MSLISRVVLLMVIVFFPYQNMEAGFIKNTFNKAKDGVKKVKKKVEHKLGWDRYILCWGDRFVPPQDRWVAIRSAIPRKKHNIGKFWDVPGDGKAVEGPNKEIKLWSITFQEYPKSDRRYRFVPVYETTKHPDDFGYYWIQAKTGMWVEAQGKGRGLKLNKGYNVDDRTNRDGFKYQWRVKNVGKNRFIFINRFNGKAIDAAGGVAKNGTIVQQWDDHGGEPVQWEFIYIAEGPEVKSTKKMAQNRTMEAARMAKDVTDGYKKIASKIGKTISEQAKKSFNKLKDKAESLIELKKSGNSYTFNVGFPDQKNIMDELKGRTLDKLFKLELKKIVLEPMGKDGIVVGFRNHIECMGHSVDLTFQFLGRWSIGKDGFIIKDFKMDTFKIPGLPKELGEKIERAISKQSQKLKIAVKHFPGSNQLSRLASGGSSTFKIKDTKTGPYGFRTTLVL